MSSENDTSINVCLLVDVNMKERGLLGLGVRGVSFIFIHFCFLTYSDSTLLKDMSSDIVQFSKSSWTSQYRCGAQINELRYQVNSQLEIKVFRRTSR